ncbi:tyrosine-type recombinase/integrase [Butyrivibrio sp. XPD2002]|uniref:tyrosine-type recombinase/integrase n=1 Tax=Butyrivibrio sp. XPD2002 TaxID=1280665 RepID=UPI00041F2319|nr:site-specific integrase [Butyrivibrio sp. XPD2002]
MIIITEKKYKQGTIYNVVKKIDKKEVIEKNVQTRVKKVTLEDEPIYMFYDSEMRPIEDAIRFINFNKSMRFGVNYKLQIISALKFLYDFLEIFEIDIMDIDHTYANYMIDFLLGISRKGLNYSLSLCTYRTNNTINLYLNAYRLYVKHLGIKEHIFLKYKIWQDYDWDGNTYHNRKKYDVSLIIGNKNHETPKYISRDDYKNIIKTIGTNEEKKAERIICRLMFEHGLRIGEVLGLTLEDVIIKKNAEGLNIYYLLLRNRVSDSSWQSAKGVLNVNSKDDYNRPDYRKEKLGYQKVMISENLAKEIIEYINIFHVGNKKYMERREKFARADSVPLGNREIEENYYLFLNSIGRPLSQDVWNKRLRKIYEKCGIPVDKGTKKNNLNHRFRHGFGMELSRNSDVLNEMDVKDFMRHHSLESTAIYHNPTEDDTRQLHELIFKEFEDDIFKFEDMEGF